MEWARRDSNTWRSRSETGGFAVAGFTPSLYLYSERDGEPMAPGAGKTHLALGIARALVAAGKSAAITRVNRLMLEVYGTFKRKDADALDVVNRYTAPDVVVLDDLGTEKWNEYNLSVLYEIISSRAHKITNHVELLTRRPRRERHDRLRAAHHQPDRGELQAGADDRARPTAAAQQDGGVMSLFVCPRCGTDENTALAVIVIDSDRLMIDRICSACGPAGWHGRFPQETNDPEKHGPLKMPGVPANDRRGAAAPPRSQVGR